jgi:hypothetical protein
MPQNEKLRRAWRKMLGDDWRDVRRRWLRRLGNLTLTGYNSTDSDRPFADKKRFGCKAMDPACKLYEGAQIIEQGNLSKYS